MTFARHPGNPILRREHVPDVPPEIVDATSVFNPGAIRLRDEVLLLLRVQTRGRRTHLLRARSRDGASFTVEREIVRVRGLEAVGERVHHLYDPRVTQIGDSLYVVLAMDVDEGCRLGVFSTEDLRELNLRSVVSGGDERNGVLFPEKVGGRYLMLSRPNRPGDGEGALSGDEIVLLESEDMREWSTVGPVMRGRLHYFDERIGAGPPPVKTRAGWLLVYHGVATHFMSANVYQAGVALLDLDDPLKVVARGRDNVLEPRESYELVGQVPNVVFPTGLLVDDPDESGFAGPDALAHVYYGAADTCVGLASAPVGALIEACHL